MDTKSLVWSTVASLPHPYTGASMTTCGDQLYMLGGADDNNIANQVSADLLTDKTTTIITIIIINMAQSC